MRMLRRYTFQSLFSVRVFTRDLQWSLYMNQEPIATIFFHNKEQLPLLLHLNLHEAKVPDLVRNANLLNSASSLTKFMLLILTLSIETIFFQFVQN